MADDNGGLWGAIGQGFQGMGAVASPQVADQQNQEYMLRQKYAMQQRDAMVQQIMQGIQTGAVDPMKGADALSKMGIDPKIISAMGPSLQAQEAQLGLQGNKQFLGWLDKQQQPQQPGMAAAPITGQLPPAAAAVSPMGQGYMKYLQEQKTLNKPDFQHYDPTSGAYIEGKGGTVTKQQVGEQKPLFEPRYPIGKDMVQPHVSFDNGKSWEPVKGSEPQHAFAKQVAPVVNIGGAGGSSGDISNLISLARQGMPRTQIVFGLGAKAGDEWKRVIDGAVGQIMKETGASKAEAGRIFAMEQAGYKATGQALAGNTKDIATLRPYEKMLQQNGDIAIDLAKKITKSDSALANKPLNWIRQNMGDNPDTAEYLAQVRIVQTEAARVINNPRLVGVLSDEARKELEQMVNGNMPMGATERVIKRLQNDGVRRVKMLEDEHDRLMKGTDSTTTPQPAAPPTAGSSVIEKAKSLLDKYRDK